MKKAYMKPESVLGVTEEQLMLVVSETTAVSTPLTRKSDDWFGGEEGSEE